jgi:aspartate/methionine/tyrosine aminotransferase
MEATERPYIEDVLDKYSSMTNLTVLALGSSYWTPPTEALDRLISSNDIQAREMHRYGNIQGDPKLREAILVDLHRRGLDRTDMDVLITPGANQAFTNAFLSLVDEGDHTGKHPHFN